MRLDEEEKNAVDKAIADVNGEVFLFGSRVDDMKKGGDIDILILTQEDSYKVSKEVMLKFNLYCEEKIDVIVMNSRKLTSEQRAFLNVIKKVRIR